MSAARKIKTAISLLKSASNHLDSIKMSDGMPTGDFIALNDIKKELDTICERLKELTK